MRKRAMTIGGGLALAVLLAGTGVAAQDDADAAAAELARLKAQTDAVEQEAKLVTAKAALAKARRDALNLPQFENKTELKTGGGTLEAAMLGADALAQAADVIAGELCGAAACPADKAFVILAGDEAFDFTPAEALTKEIAYSTTVFAAVGCPKPQMAAASVGALIGVATTAAKLFGSETQVSGIDLATALPARLLAVRLATRVNGYLPGAMIATPAGADSFTTELDVLAIAAGCATEKRAALPAAPTDASEKAAAAILDRALARYDSLLAAAMSPDEKGVVPIIAAQRLQWLRAKKPTVVRVRVEQAAGSFVSSKNLWTTLGVDPIKVSGGVIASYQVSEPTTGRQSGGDVLICRTTLTSLRKVQDARWTPRGAAPCRATAGPVRAPKTP